MEQGPEILFKPFVPLRRYDQHVSVAHHSIEARRTEMMTYRIAPRQNEQGYWMLRRLQ